MSDNIFWRWAVQYYSRKVSLPQEIDGMLVFYEENQCVAFWAIREGDLHLLDTTVYQGLAGLEWTPRT
jgi:hypothetical protein